VIQTPPHVTVPETVLFREIEGEAVLLETRTGRYYGLNEAGTRMWQLLHLHSDVERVHRELLREYEVTPEALWGDLLGFVETLTSRGLLKVC
jgi:hypothetical protein